VQRRTATLLAVGLAAIAIALALVFGGREESKAEPQAAAIPGQPTVEIVSPRNGARQNAHAVVVKVDVKDFRLAPRQFGQPPQLGEGHIRFSLNRVPDCVDPVKLQHAINSPLGKGRLIGRSFDYPQYSGPNGLLAQEIGSAGSYSPATRPEIYYRNLPTGFYRLIVSLAQNNGAVLTPSFHDVTNFQILQRASDKVQVEACPKGKVSSAAAAEKFK
jgi:hypothetical protein